MPLAFKLSPNSNGSSPSMTHLGKEWERKLSRISKQVASIMINKRHWVVEKFTQQIRCTKVVTHSANLCKIDGYIGYS
jgi:hypothetical protein